MGLDDYISSNPHRNWVLEYLAESIWYPGDLSLVRKVTVAVHSEVSSIKSLFPGEVEREGWESIEGKLISRWRQDLSKYRDPDGILWGELTGLNPQILRIVRGIFPSVRHYAEPSAAALAPSRPEVPSGGIPPDLLPKERRMSGRRALLGVAAFGVAVLLLLLASQSGLISFPLPLLTLPQQAGSPDTSPPEVLYFSPGNGSLAINPVTLVVKFSDDRLVNLSSVALFVNGIRLTPGKLTTNGLEYSGDLPLGECSVQLSISDTGGNTVNLTWSFTVSSQLQAVTMAVLEEINLARGQLGIPPLQPAESPAAANYRAQDMLARNYFNHYDTSGRLPTLFYSSLGGLYSVEENLGYMYMVGMDAEEAVSRSRELTRDMIYGDASSGWGHRDSLLDPTNNRAEVGVAWDNSRLFLVIHVIKEWVAWESIPALPGGYFSCGGTLTMEGSEVSSVLIYYSDPASHDDFVYNTSLRVLVAESRYSLGTLVAGVAPPPYYYQGIETISPLEWDVSGEEFSISFSASSLGAIAGPGEYTVVVYASNTLGMVHPYDPVRYADQLPVLTYTIMVR
ncbi:MAG: CAP domain-containing protein [Candidatus Verstraetearchaeota archaeon]|nr:CAP domain-containing protein [Candidatus Verstraetearchaeota archaeon]